MKRTNNNTYLIFAIILVISILATFFFTNQFHITKFNEYTDKVEPQLNERSEQITNLTSQKEILQSEINTLKNENIEFLNEYSIALNNINLAYGQITLSNGNMILGNYDSSLIGYDVYNTLAYFDIGKQQALDGKVLLEKAKGKLKRLEDIAPNTFFEEEVKNRLNQTESMLDVSNNLFWLSYYLTEEINEVNFGTESRAKANLNDYNDMVPYYNENLAKMNDINNKIDLIWDKEWYPNYKGTSLLS